MQQQESVSISGQAAGAAGSEGSAGAPGGPVQRVAVVVRSHRATAKLSAMLAALDGSSEYDLFVAVDETHGPVVTSGVRRLVHTAAILEPLGAGDRSRLTLLYCSEMVFGFLRESLPEHDFFLLIEDDLHFTRDARAYVERMVRAIRARPAGLDLLATKVRRADDPGWLWYDQATRFYAEPWAIFFPFTGLSARATDKVVQARREEVARAAGGEIAFVEVFVPSVLAAAGGFTFADANELVPGSWDENSFLVGLPFLLEARHWRASNVEMAHPVFDEAAYLERRFGHAQQPGGNVRAFLGDLERHASALSPSLRTEYSARAGAVLVERLYERVERLEWLAQQRG